MSANSKFRILTCSQRSVVFAMVTCLTRCGCDMYIPDLLVSTTGVGRQVSNTEVERLWATVHTWIFNGMFRAN